MDKGDIIIQPGGGLGIYRWQFTDVTNNVVNERDTSGAWSFPVNVEYGINRWFGAGLAFTYNNFIEGDSAENEKATGIDVGLTANFHIPWNLEKFDLSAHMGYAYSNFKYELNDASGGIAKSGGSVMFFGANPRLYFTADGHLGISGWYRYSMYKYANGTITDNSGNKSEFKIDGPAHSFGLGLIFRI
jgi:hypothetical protein